MIYNTEEATNQKKEKFANRGTILIFKEVLPQLEVEYLLGMQDKHGYYIQFLLFNTTFSCYRQAYTFAVASKGERKLLLRSVQQLLHCNYFVIQVSSVTLPLTSEEAECKLVLLHLCDSSEQQQLHSSHVEVATSVHLSIPVVLNLFVLEVPLIRLEASLHNS